MPASTKIGIAEGYHVLPRRALLLYLFKYEGNFRVEAFR
jgi:hypothetical protein